jgi:hypothetical protein
LLFLNKRISPNVDGHFELFLEGNQKITLVEGLITTFLRFMSCHSAERSTQAEPPAAAVACNDGVRVFIVGQLLGVAAVAWSALDAERRLCDASR